MIIITIFELSVCLPCLANPVLFRWHQQHLRFVRDVINRLRQLVVIKVFDLNSLVTPDLKGDFVCCTYTASLRK